MRILHGLAIASAMLISLPAFSPPAEAGDRHHRHGHGHKHGHHGHYYGGKPGYDGAPYRVDHRWRGPAPGYYVYPPGYYAYPAPVYYYPPPPRHLPHGPSISVTIPLD